MSTNNNIQGSASVSLDFSVGGDARVNGNAEVCHNLIVKGWLEAPNIKGPLKGFFNSEEALKRAYPRPMAGWYALVGSTLPADIWVAELIGRRWEWAPTGEVGGEFSLPLDRMEYEVSNLRDDVRDLKGMVGDGAIDWSSVAFEPVGDGCRLAFSVRLADGRVTREGVDVPGATDTECGFMSAEDKRRLGATEGRAEANSKQLSEHAEVLSRLPETVGRIVEDALARSGRGYVEVDMRQLNRWLEMRPTAIRHEAGGQMLRIVEDGAVVCIAEWYSNYSEADGECLSGVMRLRGYGICRCEDACRGVFAYEPVHHGEYSEWEIADGGDHWGTPVDVTPRRCECRPADALSPGEIDGIWSGTGPGASGSGSGVFSREDIDKMWEEIRNE